MQVVCMIPIGVHGPTPPYVHAGTFSIAQRPVLNCSLDGVPIAKGNTVKIPAGSTIFPNGTVIAANGSVYFTPTRPVW